MATNFLGSLRSTTVMILKRGRTIALVPQCGDCNCIRVASTILYPAKFGRDIIDAGKWKLDTDNGGFPAT